MNLNIESLWIYFLIYSIAGWILESVYRSFCEKRIVNSGFLNGPLCPIYGVGAIIMLLFLRYFKDDIVLLFIISFLVFSAWEYIVGVLLEKIFKTKYWDYSDQKFNLKGRICLFNSVCWGILGVIFIHFIHPFVINILQNINPTILKIIFITISFIFMIDTVISIIKIKGIRATLDKIEELNEQIKEKIDEIRNINKKNNINKSIEIKQELQKSLEQLKKRKNRIFRNLYRRVYRLKKAFPTIETKEITEILSKKLDVIRNRNNKEKINK